MSEITHIINRLKFKSVLIRIGKLALLLSSIATLMWMLLPTLLNKKSPKLTIDQIDEPTNESQVNHMIKPSYEGTNSDGKFYKITAEIARQTNGEEKVTLEEVTANIDTENLGNVLLSSHIADFDTKNKILHLKQAVHMRNKQGYSAKTDNMKMDLEQGVLSGNGKIHIHAPGISITGDGFLADRKKSLIELKRNVSVEYSKVKNK